GEFHIAIEAAGMPALGGIKERKYLCANGLAGGDMLAEKGVDLVERWTEGHESLQLIKLVQLQRRLRPFSNRIGRGPNFREHLVDRVVGNHAAERMPGYNHLIKI